MERRIEVRWGRGDDVEAIGNLLEFDGSPRRDADEERFIVAEEGGRLLATIRVRATPGRMDLWGFVADPRVREGEAASELYRGAWTLAKELGIPEVWADDDRRRDALLGAGYRRRIGGWKLAEEPASPPKNPASPSFLFGIFGA
ncbi:MAG: GNAT family N-acetyltransferase [Rubrobacter sp.]|nr:GNAT family N-acetyltransferase [Rubrobacter sp.]